MTLQAGEGWHPLWPRFETGRIADQSRARKYYVYWVLFFFGQAVVMALLAGIVKPVSVCTLRMSDEAIFVGRAL